MKISLVCILLLLAACTAPTNSRTGERTGTNPTLSDPDLTKHGVQTTVWTFGDIVYYPQWD